MNDKSILWLFAFLVIVAWELSDRIADWLTPKILSWIRRRKDGDRR